ARRRSGRIERLDVRSHARSRDQVVLDEVVARRTPAGTREDHALAVCVDHVVPDRGVLRVRVQRYAAVRVRVDPVPLYDGVVGAAGKPESPDEPRPLAREAADDHRRVSATRRRDLDVGTVDAGMEAERLAWAQ